MSPYVTLGRRTKNPERRKWYAIVRGNQWRQLEKKKAAQERAAKAQEC